MKNLLTNEHNFGSPRSMQSINDYRHDRLFKCSICSIKFDITQLIQFKERKICKYCLNSGGKECSK